MLCHVQLDALTINLEGGVASLRVDGYPTPMSLYVGVAEAAAILYASGMEFRRPSTVNAWQNSLKVCDTMWTFEDQPNSPATCPPCFCLDRHETLVPDCKISMSAFHAYPEGLRSAEDDWSSSAKSPEEPSSP